MPGEVPCRASEVWIPRARGLLRAFSLPVGRDSPFHPLKRAQSCLNRKREANATSGKYLKPSLYLGAFSPVQADSRKIPAACSCVQQPPPHLPTPGIYLSVFPWSLCRSQGPCLSPLLTIRTSGTKPLITAAVSTPVYEHTRV